MAKLDEYWKQVTASPSFQDLGDTEKEKVRNHLFEKYVQSAGSYTSLPQSQRLAVKKHYDEVTKIEPESMGQSILKAGKKVVEKVKPIAKEMAQGASNIPVAAEAIEPAPMRKAYEGLTKVSEGISRGAEALGQKIEPSEATMEEHVQKGGSLTDFDMARMVASGAVKTGGDFIASAIPTNYLQTAAYPIADALLKYAGTTFLGKPISDLWKPRTGLSSGVNAIGDQFEKIITKTRIENNGRLSTDGPPKPLEVLAHKEMELKAQAEHAEYQDWLERLDKLSPSGGEPEGDLYPEMKTNVTQLRDAAKERLQKLQGEPVRVESLANAEDELAGYYRRRIDRMKVYMMPPGPETEPQGLLPGGPQPAGLLKPGEPPPAPTKRPPATPPKAPSQSPTPPAGPAPTPGPQIQTNLKAKDVLFNMYKAYYPDQAKQALEIRAGAALKGFGFKPGQELNEGHLTMLEKFMEQEHADHMASQTTPKPVKGPHDSSEIGRLKQKGLDPIEVQVEAKRLQQEYELNRQTNLEAKRRLKEVTGGVGFHDPDPMTGKVPEQEEVLRNVSFDMRGKTKPDQAAQMAHEAGLIKGPSSSDLYEHMRNLKSGGPPRSAKSFLDEAERNIEAQMRRDAGFFSEEDTMSTLGGQQAPEAAPPIQATGEQTTIAGTQAKFPDKPLKDLKNMSAYDLASEWNKRLGEGGKLGGGDIDPVRQAALEAITKEMVDRAMAMGYQTSQDIMLYVARNAPKELQDALRKNLHPTLSAFDPHPYKEMEAAKQGNQVAKKSMMDAAQRGYFQKKADIVRGSYKKFKANQQVVVFKDMDEGLMRLQNDLFIHDNYRKFSKDELAAQRWYTEGKSPRLDALTSLGIPENQAKRWLELAKNPTENMKKARPMTQVFEDEYHELISEFYDHVGYVEDHVTRRWKQEREYLDWEGKTLGNKPNFLKGRKLLTQADGINAGLEPVSYDIREDLRASNNTRVNVMSRIHAYQKLGASFGPDGMPAIMDEAVDVATQAKNAKVTPHQGQAPNSWMRFDHVPLLKGLAINPYFKPAINFMMSRPFTGTIPEVLDFLSASTKATKLIGFFHGYTLGEMTMSGVSYRDVFSFGKDRNPLFRGLRYLAKGMTADMEGKPLNKNPIKAVGELYNSFMSGSAVLANRPLALDMAEHGFKFGSVDEDMHGILKKYLVKTEDYLKKRIGEGLAKGITALPRTAVDIQEKGLWSYIRPVSSMLVYETNYADAALKNLQLPAEKRIPIEALKQAIVNQTSKEMGGISYARLMINPRTQQVLQWAMLAPGWTIGRALMGASVFEKGPEGRQARKQMAKLFVGWFISSNMINFAQTKKYLGKGRYMWDNPEGYRNQAFLSKDKDGTKYLQLSKALTEIYDDVMYPARTAAYKLSAPVQGAAKVMNWATAKAYYPGLSPENPLKSALHMYEPMITSGQSAYGGLPVRQGPSRNRIEGVLDQYYSGGMKDPALFQEAMQMATEQGFDVSKLDRAVRAARTSKEKRALFK